jgi:hypothetical protein
MRKDKDTMIIEVRFRKCKKTLIVWFMKLVPSRNIGGDVGHRQILGNIGEEQIESFVGCGRGVNTGTTCPNLQLKVHENKRKEKTNKTKRKFIWKMRKRKDTNFGNEFLDARICGEGTSRNLGIQHKLNHVHIFDEGKRVKGIRRRCSRI